MCGIFGLVTTSSRNLDRAAWSKAVRSLFLLSQSRGKEAAGIALANGAEIVVHKDSVSAEAMLRTPDYERAVARGSDGFFEGRADQESLAAIGHARLVTNGLQGIDANNQPVWRDDIVIVHNGIVTNWEKLWAENPDVTPRAEVDTEVIAALMHKRIAAGDTPRAALAGVFGDVYGETSVALFIRGTNELLLGTNTGSVHYCVSRAGDAFFFASEKWICQKLTAGGQTIPGFEGVAVRQLTAGRGMAVDLTRIAVDEFAFADGVAAPQLSPMLATQRNIEEKAYRLKLARAGMRRCTRCILPETMPYIAYDADGVCNYCHTHEPWVKRPESDLEEYLAKFRGDGKSPDCVVAFSGGRDSSYGLHLLKEKYGMQPITFSYDWGMVTDLARRNQARMCGKLGIEHIWISADIKQKRANIRRNVEAWLKKPDLGIIPLFMAGDKQFFWYANALIKQTGIPLMVFCTNQLEKTDFKLGFLDIAPQTSGFNQPSSFGLGRKAQMLMEYGKRYIANPRYINRSIPDTAWAFVSYYGINQDHLYLFDYVEWNEEEIDDVLINGYDWELAEDTQCTWRIGDGTAAFYNYIYTSVAGFSEHDTFRSNQIREGQITRERALALVERDNQPRWKSIREYAQLINLDFDEAIRAIDRIPKLYAPKDA
ncbi:MAG: hypothetical protein MEP57_04335 [Microvirga sp.]|nr:hypothetical protein [Microvirga sp.]